MALQHLQLVGTRSLEKRLTRRFAIGFEHQILALPERFYSQRHASDIAGRMGINASIAEFIGGRLIPILTGLVLLVFYLILTFLYSPWLGLLILSTTAINALVVQLNLRTQKDNSISLQPGSLEVNRKGWRTAANRLVALYSVAHLHGITILIPPREG